MTDPVTADVRRAPVDKHEERRVQLGWSALRTLGELGYARTSLREVAQRSEFSHGVLHYYFADKLELITYAVRLHKSECVHRYDAVTEAARTPEELASGFAAKLVETITVDGPLHMLWYDVRGQSMFEPGLRPTVLEIEAWLDDMVWRVVSRYAELSGRPAAFDRLTTYSLFDGVFEKALFRHVTGDPEVLATLVDQVHGLLPMTLVPAAGLVAPVR